MKVKNEVGAIIEEFKYIKVRWESDHPSSPTPGGAPTDNGGQFEMANLGHSMLGRS